MSTTAAVAPVAIPATEPGWSCCELPVGASVAVVFVSSGNVVGVSVAVDSVEEAREVVETLVLDPVEIVDSGVVVSCVLVGWSIEMLYSDAIDEATSVGRAGKRTSSAFDDRGAPVI